jgi:hypothetical protein
LSAPTKAKLVSLPFNHFAIHDLIDHRLTKVLANGYLCVSHVEHITFDALYFAHVDDKRFMYFYKNICRQLLFQFFNSNVHHQFPGGSIKHHIIHHRFGVQQIVINYFFDLVVAFDKKVIVLFL